MRFWWIPIALVAAACDGEPVAGKGCKGTEQGCDATNTPFQCVDGVWEEAPAYCVCGADDDGDGFGDMQCAAVAQ